MNFKLVEIDLLIVIVEDDYKTFDEKKKKLFTQNVDITIVPVLYGILNPMVN